MTAIALGILSLWPILAIGAFLSLCFRLITKSDWPADLGPIDDDKDGTL